MVLLTGLLPFRLLYLLSDFTAFLFFRVIGYRKDVVMKNLKASFPGKSEDELKKIAAAAYKNLTDITLEGIKVFSMNTATLLKRFKLMNPEVLSRPEYRNKSIIILAGHLCNWEWGVLTAPAQTGRTVVGFYKPLANKYIDAYLRKNRERGATVLVSIKETAAYFNGYIKKNVLFVLIADQNPSNPVKSIWVDFFGRQTAFLHGPEKYGKRYDLPVFFVEVNRLKRGYYTYQLHHITDHPARMKEGELTEKYARILESVIRKNPENWLWTHRRWKHKIEDPRRK